MFVVEEFKNKKITEKFLAKFVKNINKNYNEHYKIILWLEACDFTCGVSMHKFFTVIKASLKATIEQVSFTDIVLDSEQFQNDNPVYSSVLICYPEVEHIGISGTKDTFQMIDTIQFSRALSRHTKLSQIELKKIMLTDDEAMILSSAIMNNESLVSLELDTLKLNKVQFKMMLCAIKRHPYLQKLNFTRLLFGDDAEGAGEYFYEFLHQNPKLRSLSLSENDFKSSFFESLANAIPTMTQLNRLCIYETLEQQSIVDITNGVSESDSIEDFSINNTVPILSHNSALAVTRLIYKNHKLKRLTIQQASELAHEDKSIILNALEENTTLELLHIPKLSGPCQEFVRAIHQKCRDNLNRKSTIRRIFPQAFIQKAKVYQDI